MAQQSKTYDVRLVWLTLAAIIGFGILFVTSILPMTRGTRSPLLGTLAPDFNLPVIMGGSEGSRLKLSDLRGRVVVLDFWAGWCEPCKEQAPIVDNLARELATRNITFVGVSTSNTERDAAKFLEGHAASYASVFDEQNAVAKAYSVDTLPSLIVVDTKGVVAAVHNRLVPEKQLRKQLDELLAH